MRSSSLRPPLQSPCQCEAAAGRHVLSQVVLSRRGRDTLRMRMAGMLESRGEHHSPPWCLCFRRALTAAESAGAQQAVQGGLRGFSDGRQCYPPPSKRNATLGARGEAPKLRSSPGRWGNPGIRKKVRACSLAFRVGSRRTGGGAATQRARYSFDTAPRLRANRVPA